MEKVLLGMSGGTDSSVSAMLLQEQGYEVIGITLHLFDNFQAPGQAPPFIAEAQHVASQLGIRHITYQATQEFSETVLSYFLNEYMSGRTPFPCIVCNKHIKWKILEQVAGELGCEKIATGHYVRVVDIEGRKYFAEGADPDKDQSFFLWDLAPRLLERIIFPLGNLTKPEVRGLAAQRGFENVARKKDSLGVCFIEGNDYRPFLRKMIKENGLQISPGNYIGQNGETIGRHEGFPFYTIGQRRGLNHGQNKALFVTAIDAGNNTVELGSFEALMSHKIYVKGYHFYHRHDIDPSKEYIVKVRYRNQATPCHIETIDNGPMVIHLHEKLHSVAPGQSAVLFDRERVIGGGVIEKGE